MHVRIAVLAVATAVAVFTPAAAAQTSAYFRCDQNDETQKDEKKGPLHYIVRPNEMRLYRTPGKSGDGRGFLSANMCQEPGATCTWKDGTLTLREKSGDLRVFGTSAPVTLYGWSIRGRKGSVLCEALNNIPYAEHWDQADWINGEAFITRTQ